MITVVSDFDKGCNVMDNGDPMEATLALLADGANVERGGKLNLLGVFDQVYADKFPYFHPEMYVVVRLTAGPAEFGRKKSFEISLLDPDGKLIGTMKGKGEVPQPANATRASLEIVMRLVNVPFEKSGHYAVSVLVGGDEKASIPLEVIERKPKRRTKSGR